MATIAWPASPEEACALPRYPLRFVRCLDTGCGHLYNAAFDYAAVPYTEKPNRMFNRGSRWKLHLIDLCHDLLRTLPDRPTVVEIGCGEGHLLRALAEAQPQGRYIGFDPNASVETGNATIEVYPELFYPAHHLPSLRPDLLISRHVLEHMTNPLGFLQMISASSALLGEPLKVFIEVPCVDRLWESKRVADLYYEHNSHFTTLSLTRLLSRAGATVEWIRHGYNREVVMAMVTLGEQSGCRDFASEARAFSLVSRSAKEDIGGRLGELVDSGTPVVVWGGTGKGAAFMQYYGMDAQRFPLVVDSDIDKVGTYVPGMGQRIEYRDILKARPQTSIILPAPWRARDILDEINRECISYRQILIEHEGRLIDFLHNQHPY